MFCSLPGWFKAAALHDLSKFGEHLGSKSMAFPHNDSLVRGSYKPMHRSTGVQSTFRWCAVIIDNYDPHCDHWDLFCAHSELAHRRPLHGHCSMDINLTPTCNVGDL